MGENLANLKPTRKSWVIRSNLADIEKAIRDGCSYEQIATALTADTGIEITPTLLAVYLQRERNKAAAKAKKGSS